MLNYSIVLALPNLSEEQKSQAQSLFSLKEELEKITKQSDIENRALVSKQNELTKTERCLGRAKCVKTRACIDYRSQMQTKQIQDYFDRISVETGNETVGEKLPVFCVSAAKYLDFVDDEELSPGFPERRNTGIPQLQKRLEQTTWHARHRNAKASLIEVEALFHSVKLWVQTIDPTYHLDVETRRAIEERFEDVAEDMVNVSS